MTALATPHTDRDQWLRERRRGIGASEAPVILGLVGSRLKLYLDKRGELDPEEPNEAMQAGLDLETYIAKLYERRTGMKIVESQVCLQHPNMPWMLATIDGVREDGRIVEFKTIGEWSVNGKKLGDDGDSETLPDSWTVQVAQQLELARASGISEGTDADVAVLGPTIHRFRVYPLRRSADLFDVISPAVNEFWHHHVIPGIPPEDVEAADADTLAKVYRAQSGEWLTLGDDVLDLARRYHEMGRIEGEAGKERKAIKAQLLMAIGNADGVELPGGWRITRKVVETNYKAREAYTGTSIRLTVKEPR